MFPYSFAVETSKPVLLTYAATEASVMINASIEVYPWMAISLSKIN